MSHSLRPYSASRRTHPVGPHLSSSSLGTLQRGRRRARQCSRPGSIHPEGRIPHGVSLPRRYSANRPARRGRIHRPQLDPLLSSASRLSRGFDARALRQRASRRGSGCIRRADRAAPLHSVQQNGRAEVISTCQAHQFRRRRTNYAAARASTVRRRDDLPAARTHDAGLTPDATETARLWVGQPAASSYADRSRPRRSTVAVAVPKVASRLETASGARAWSAGARTALDEERS